MLETSSASERRIVIHASDSPGDAQRAVEVAKSMQDAFPGIAVRIVISGEAITAVPDLPAGEAPKDVEIGVCAIGLRRRGIDETAVPAGVEIFPTAPIAIAEAQFEGAAYLRL